LYVSRFIVRSYGGELRFEPQPQGACFTIELPTV
jgi:signal transduction histidine kinase